MALIEELHFNEKTEEDNENLSVLKQIVRTLMESEFSGRLKLLKNFVITNDLKKTEQIHGYRASIRDTAQGCSILLEDGYYDIVINYSNLPFNDENGIKDITSFIYHEFQHVSDYDIYNDFIDKYKSRLGKTHFFELRASYYSQLYTKRNKRGTDYLGICEKIWKVKQNVIFEKIENLNNHDTEKIKEFNKLTYEFNQEVIYDLMLCCGENMADNEIESGTKNIELQITGLEEEINKLLNDYIINLNKAVKSSEEIITFLLENELLVFNYLCDIAKAKLRKLHNQER